MWVLTIRPRFKSSHNVSTGFSPALNEWGIAKTVCSQNLVRRDPLVDTGIGSGKILTFRSLTTYIYVVPQR